MSIAPEAEPQEESVNPNSPLTPPFMVIDGILPHFGEIFKGSSGQVPPGVVHANHILVNFTISPQL